MASTWRTQNSELHYVLTDANGETVATDKVGAKGGFQAYARMMQRMAEAAGTDRLRCADETGTRFHGGFALEGPFQTL